MQAKIFNICNNTCHSAYKALLICNLPHLCHRIHCLVRRCRIIKKSQHHRCFSFEKGFPYILRQHLDGKTDICGIIVP